DWLPGSKNRRHKFQVARFGNCKSNLRFQRFERNRILIVGETSPEHVGSAGICRSNQAIDFYRQRFGCAWSEQKRNLGLQTLEIAIRNIDITLLAERANQTEAFFRSRSWKQGDLDVNTTWTFEIDFDEIRTTRRQDPNQLAATRTAPHLLREHGI